ncbi:hypothetical protein [Bacteroides sp.]
MLTQEAKRILGLSS